MLGLRAAVGSRHIVLILLPAAALALCTTKKKSYVKPVASANLDPNAAAAAAIASVTGSNPDAPAATWPVNIDLPPESVTMQSWNVLKGSMDNLGEQVQQVLLVRSDMSSLQTDLQTQQGLWEKAEKGLKDENAELARQIEALKLQVEAGKSVNDDLADIQHQVEETRRNSSDLKHLFDDGEKRHLLEMGFLQNRSKDLVSQHAELNRTAEIEVAKAHDAQIHVQGDYQALRMKAAELQDRLRDGQKGLPLQQEQLDAKTRDLGRQLAEMQKGMSHMTDQLLPAGTLEKEISSLKHAIETETENIIKLSEEQAMDANNCEVERKKHESILRSESFKFDVRDKEVAQLCEAVNARRTVLNEMIQKCEAGKLPENMPPPERVAA